MRNATLAALLIVVMLVFFTGSAIAQQMPNPYGPNVNLATAKKVAEAAATEAVKMKVNFVITVVDTGGNLVYLERFDKAQFGSIDVAVHKARCSVAYKRPTKAFEEAVSSGKIMLLTLGRYLRG